MSATVTVDAATFDWTSTMLTAAFACIVALIGSKLYSFYKTWTFFKALPTPDWSPLFGNMHLIPSDPEGQNRCFAKIMKEMPKWCVFWLSPIHPHVFVYHPDTMAAVYRDPDSLKPRGTRQSLEFGYEWLSDALSMVNGKQWMRTRKRLNPAFHAGVLKTYIDQYNLSADKLFQKLDEFAESGESFDLFPILTTCLMETMLKCLFGWEEDFSQYENGHHPYAEAILDLSDIWMKRFWNALMWPEFVYQLSSQSKEFTKKAQYMRVVCGKILDKRLAQLEKTGVPDSTKGLSLIDQIILGTDENGQRMSRYDMVSQINSFFFAAHDTTATGMSFCVYNLAKNQKYQKKIQEEVDEILEGRDSEEIVWDDLPKLKWLSVCSKENMRIYQPIPLMPRTSNKEIEIEGVKMPPGTIFLMSINMTHNNPTVWDQPEEFRPERHINPTYSKYAFVPFSTGPRTCIGQVFSMHKERVLLSRFFHRYNVGLAPGYTVPIRRMATVMKPDNGIWITLSRRKK